MSTIFFFFCKNFLCLLIHKRMLLIKLVVTSHVPVKICYDSFPSTTFCQRPASKNYKLFSGLVFLDFMSLLLQKKSLSNQSHVFSIFSLNAVVGLFSILSIHPLKNTCGFYICSQIQTKKRFLISYFLRI